MANDRPVQAAEIAIPQVLQRPSSARYKALGAALAAAERNRRNGQHTRVAAIDQLRAFIEFIRSDPAFDGADMLTPSMRLHSALHDSALGGKQPMLFDGAIDDPAKRGKPTKQVFHLARGIILCALSLLIEQAVENAKAASLLESMLSDQGVRLPGGKAITARRILQWRAQTNESAPEWADEAAKLFVATREQRRIQGAGTAEEATQRAEDLIRKIPTFWDSR